MKKIVIATVISSVWILGIGSLGKILSELIVKIVKS